MLLRRILLLLTVAALMVATVVASAGPAFAQVVDDLDEQESEAGEVAPEEVDVVKEPRECEQVRELRASGNPDEKEAERLAELTFEHEVDEVFVCDVEVNQA